MYCYSFEIVLQEVPGEISLCFTISGCPLRCEGCHSPFLWKEGLGEKLTFKHFVETLNKYRGLASCVLFMGGEWHSKHLIRLLKYARSTGYETCLYSGENKVDRDILQHLTWIKTGRWNSKLGGLNSPNTNQQFIELETNKKLNHLFIKN